MLLKRDTVNKLKNTNKNRPDMLADRQFVKLLLISAFGKYVLAESSLFGQPARNASDVVHAPWNTQKVQLIKDIFKRRVDSDKARYTRFNEIVNKHCNNARASTKKPL